MSDGCPVCLRESALVKPDSKGRDAFECKCPNCGNFVVSGTAFSMLEGGDSSLSKETRTVLAHMIWLMQNGNAPEISSEHVRIAEKEKLAVSADALIDKLVLAVGKLASKPGQRTQFDALDFTAKLGCADSDSVNFAVQTAKDKGYLNLVDMRSRDGDAYIVSLTYDGWKHYESLRSHPERSTRRGFMAMPFPNAEKGSDYPGNVVKPAYEALKKGAAEAGFHLENPLLAEPKSGNIIDHLKVEIRRAKFLVADLTGGNSGVYWEAGFAEGLGRKVIYTCEDSHFDKIHFDTKQMQTIRWKTNELQEASDLLRDILRNTFPVEASMPRDELDRPAEG